MTKEDQAALKAAQDMIKQGQNAKDQAAIDAGMEAQSEVLGKNGIVYPSGRASAGNEDPSDYLKQQYAAQTEAELAQLKSAYETSMKGYDAAAEQLPATYQQAKNAVAGQNAQEKRAFDERAVAAGLNSGTSGQAQLAMSGAYLSQLAGLDREQAQKRSEIDRARAQLQSEYQAAIASAKAGRQADLAGALYSELLRAQSIRQAQEQQKDEWKREDEVTAAKQRREDELRHAEQAREDQLYARELARELGITDPAVLSRITGLSDLAGLIETQKGPDPAPVRGVIALTPPQIETVFGADAPYTRAGMIGQGFLPAAGPETQSGTTYGWESLTSGGGPESIILQAKSFVEKHPNVAWDSRTIDNYLNSTPLTSEEKKIFKEYMKVYSPAYGDQR